MNTQENKYKGLIVEYHIIQSFPVTCLNRDDVGAPKTAEIGGSTRARVSSQCWKRQVRQELRNFGVQLGMRTKKIEELLTNKMQEMGLDEKKAKECATHFITMKDSIFSKDTIHFFTDTEVRALAEYAKKKDYDTKLFESKEILKTHKDALKISKANNLNGLDIALFGRMAASAAKLNVEAAASFSHAISTHKIANELDFFTALDDIVQDTEEMGAGHLGVLEFNSATYYRYISLNIGQLVKTLGDETDIAQMVDSFSKALFVAIPQARQSTMTGVIPWDYAHVTVRRGPRIQVSFEAPVRSRGEGYAKPSIEALKAGIETHRKSFGSLYGEHKDFIFGAEKKEKSIDDLVAFINTSINEV